MTFGAQQGREDPVVDVTPLIDIIFQLVLFFMVSTTFVTTQGIEVDLPRASAEAVLRDKGDLRVQVTTEGSVVIDDQAVTWAQLREQVQQAARADPGTLVVIKADRDVDHGRVVAIMDLARSYGLPLAIATEANAADGPEDAAEPGAGKAGAP